MARQPKTAQPKTKFAHGDCPCGSAEPARLVRLPGPRGLTRWVCPDCAPALA